MNIAPFVLVCMFALLGCATKTSNKPITQSSDSTGFRPMYSTRKFYYIEEARENARSHGYDYKDIVTRASHKDSAALKELFTLNFFFDGAAGEEDISVQSEMLLLWGDYDFSRVIASMTPKERRKLRVPWYNGETFRMCFPLTADVIFGYRKPGIPAY